MVTDTVSSGRSGLPTSKPTKSFWHSEPSSFLIGHHTTPSLPGAADIVIIGSGISGASAAYHLLKRKKQVENWNVVMLEAREACWGATGRNGGHCQPGIYTSPPEVAAFELRNYEAIEALISQHNIPCDWKSLPGCHSYMSASMFNMAVSDSMNLQKQCPELAKLITVVTKDSETPSLADLRIPNAAGAIIQKNAASLWPYKFVSWILQDLVKLGSLNLQTNTPATNLQKVDEGWIVHTSQGMISTPTILLCTNAYTSALLPWFEDLIVPVRGEMSSLIPPSSMKPASTTHLPLDHSYVFRGHGNSTIDQDDYLIQRPFSDCSDSKTISESIVGGELMFGGGRNLAPGVGISNDSSIDERSAAYLRRELNVVLDLQHNSKELEASYEWSGIMGFSRDGYPWVGPATEPGTTDYGLWVCGGYTGHGMPNAWLSGAAAVDLMIGKAVGDVDLPKQYLVTDARVAKARTLDEVWLADKKAYRDA